MEENIGTYIPTAALTGCGMLPQPPCLSPASVLACAAVGDANLSRHNVIARRIYTYAVTYGGLLWTLCCRGYTKHEKEQRLSVTDRLDNAA